MALALTGTGNGSLNNLSLTTNTGTVVDTSVNPFLAYDSWYLTSNWTNTSSANITSWSRRPASYVRVGDAMTHSSGTFSFPITGLWLIRLEIFFNFTTATNDQFQCYIRTGTSGTPNTNAGAAVEGGGGTGDHMGRSTTQLMFDVTDTTNCVVAFEANSISSGNFFVGGATSYGNTICEFYKLGET